MTEHARNCDHCGMNIGPNVDHCPSCGSGLVHGTEAPNNVVGGKGAAMNAGKVGLGCLVLIAIVVLLAWVLG